MRRLNDTDLANNVLLKEEDQYNSLRRLVSSFSPYSLNYVRARFPDIFNLIYPLFEGVVSHRTSIDVIRALLFKKCRTEKELANNIAVAELLYAFSEENVAWSLPISIAGIRLAQERRYWIPLSLVIQDEPTIVFVDPRGGSGLSAAGRRFVFSAMHAGLRELDPTLEAARLMIIQLPKDRDGDRHISIHRGDEVPLLGYEEIESLSMTTEAIWLRVLEEEQRRRRA